MRMTRSRVPVENRVENVTAELLLDRKRDASESFSYNNAGKRCGQPSARNESTSTFCSYYSGFCLEQSPVAALTGQLDGAD